MIRRRAHRLLRLAACVIAATLFSGTVHAQDNDAAALIATPNAPDANVGVFVRDSAVAADKLALAGRMEKAGQWDTSADVYQEVLDGFADRVVATHFNAQGQPDRYGGVTSVIQDRIAAWPAAGHDVYIARFGTAAAHAMETVDPSDRIALGRIADRYFVTDAGRDAALRLIELHFNAGEFAACASLADRVLDKHPALSDADRPMLMLRSAIAWQLAGEPNRAAPRKEQLAKQFPQAHATIAGEDRLLTDVLAAAPQQLAVAGDANAGHTSGKSWSVPFGSNDHAAVVTEPDAPTKGQPPREWGKLVSFELEDNTMAMTTAANGGANDADLSTMRAMIKRQRDLGSTTGILPSLDGSQLFFQDNQRIYARDLDTGASLPGWLATYKGDAGAYKIDAPFTPRGAQMAVTLTDRYVVAILGQNDAAMNIAMGGNGQLPGAGGARLVCLDRVTGKALWTRTMNDAATAKAAKETKTKKPAPQAADNAPKVENAAPAPVAGPLTPAQARAQRLAAIRAQRRVIAPNGMPVVPGLAVSGDESLRATEPRGSALVVGDAVYVVARGGEPGAFEDCYLVCFSLADGEYRWARHLASGNASRMNVNGMPQANEADSHLACVDGRIFVSTDMGAIAAVDAGDGNLAWLSLYPRPRPTQQPWLNGDAMTMQRVKPAFEGNPVIIRDGKVITIPSDGEDLFVHDVTTGEEIARVSTKWHLTDGGLFADPQAKGSITDDRVDDVNVLAGISGDKLVVASPQAVSTLDWTKLRAGNNGVAFAPRDVVLRREEIRKPGYEDLAIRGRPFVTDRSVYVPTAWALFRIDLDSGTALERYPANDDWQNRTDEAAGNVMVVDGNVIVAGPQRVSVYAGLGLVRQRLDAAIASAPNAVAPRLRFAEAMANAGHNDEAIKSIDEAAARVNARKPAAEDADRASLFTSCFTLVQSLNRPGRTPDADFQAKLLDRLTTVAATPMQQVTSRLLRGGLAAQAKDYATAIDAYQALIDQPAWGSLRAKVGNDAVPVSKIAGDAIKVLLATDAGRNAYVAVEARAAAELQKAIASNDTAAILAVVEHYPNAKSAGGAVKAVSDLLSQQSNAAAPTMSVASLRKLAASIADPKERAGVDEAMLRAYLASNNLPAALGRARKLAWIDINRPLTALPAAQSSANASTAGALVAQLQQAVFDQQEAALPDLKANLDGDSFDAPKLVAVKDTASMLVPDALSTSRTDRVITISQGRQLKVFAAGATEPLATIKLDGLTDRVIPTWLPGDRILLRQPSRVACADVGKASIAWEFDPTTLPPAASDSGVASVAIDDAALIALAPRPSGQPTEQAALSPIDAQLEQAVQQGNMDPIVALNQRRLIRQNVLLRNRNGLVPVADGSLGGWDADAKPDDNAKEAMAEAQPMAGGSLIAVATTRGQVVALDSRTGQIKWRVKLGDRAPATFRVVDDLLVYATTDDSASRVITLDSATGNEVMRHTFSNGIANRVRNVAVSDEGWLTVVTCSGIQLFDLIGGAVEPIATASVGVETGTMPFFQTRSPDQVQFCGGKLLILSDYQPPVPTNGQANANGQIVVNGQVVNGQIINGQVVVQNVVGQVMPTVRSFDLQTLQPTRVTIEKTKQIVERRYVPRFAKDQRIGNETIELAVHRDRLYINTGQFMTSYPTLDEDPNQNAWSRVLPDQPSMLSQQSPLLVKDGVLIIGWPKDFVTQTSPSARAELYSRQTYDGKHESGMCVEDAELSRRNGKIVDKFQPVTGGVYYTTTDGTLLFLPGKAKAPDAAK